MSKPFSILHISDLHRSPRDPISNDELISALVSDRDRYVRETPAIPAPEAIVVSGDIIQGVGLNTSDFESRLVEQYETAEAFLDEVVRRFLGGDRSRLILIPGNHDIDWNTAFNAMVPVDPKDIPPNLASLLFSDRSSYRWDWKALKLYRVADPALYEQRLGAFWKFFERFYSGVPGLLKVKPGADANLFSLCDDRIGVAAFNSCHGNDCFAFHGMIRREAIARSHLELNDTGKVFDLRLAVWHHSIEGPPYRTDYMDIDIVRGMIGRGFRIGLYGHQHKTQAIPHQVWMPDRERMAAVSAGSLCAGAAELPTGVYRQYNILEFARGFTGVRVHVRAMSVANLFSRGQLRDFGDKSYADLDWAATLNLVGEATDTKTARARAIIDEAEAAAKSGKPDQAVALLEPLEMSPGSYQRQLYLGASAASKNWAGVVRVTTPPTTIEELVQHVDALSNLARHAEAHDVLAACSTELQLPQSVANELKRRIAAQKAVST